MTKLPACFEEKQEIDTKIDNFLRYLKAQNPVPFDMLVRLKGLRDHQRRMRMACENHIKAARGPSGGCA